MSRNVSERELKIGAKVAHEAYLMVKTKPVTTVTQRT